jgi:hypothetical protein
MQTEKITPLEERAEIVQNVIDRLLYLSPEQVAEYKRTLDLMHRVYSVNVQIVNGVRIYSLNKNLQ